MVAMRTKPLWPVIAATLACLAAPASAQEPLRPGEKICPDWAVRSVFSAIARNDRASAARFMTGEPASFTRRYDARVSLEDWSLRVTGCNVSADAAVMSFRGRFVYAVNGTRRPARTVTGRVGLVRGADNVWVARYPDLLKTGLPFFPKP